MIEAARNGLTFVFILLKDPGSATTVFEGLNDPGAPISVGDLVKNEVFARKGYDAEDAQYLHDEKWVPFFNKFGPLFNDYFFPYAVIQKSSSSKSDMFKNLRDAWKGKDSSEIIEHLDIFSRPYLALHGKHEELISFPKQIRESIVNLHRSKQPSSALPFEMKLLEHFLKGQITKGEVAEILKLIEAFFVRRALCGVEPTGLLGMFRTMWSNMDGHPTATRVADVILKRQTIEWPSDVRLKEQIAQRSLYTASISRYVIFEYDKSFNADQGDFDEFTVEHVLPQSLTSEWEQKFSKEEHADVKDLWANLLPLTSKMNSDLKQLNFKEKRTVFQSDSMFASARQFGEHTSDWNPDTLDSRSEELFTWAKERWPRP